jgi:hypothetical protein
LISDRQKEDSRFFSLFENVRFEYLSSESMQSFIALITESFDLLTFPIWRALCPRLSFSVSIEPSVDRFIHQYSSVVCRFDMNSKQDGIISYLTKRYGGHVIDRNIVSITVSSIYNPQSFPLRHVAEFENQSYFATKNEANSWICYDSIRSRRDSNSHHLRSWTLEGSQVGLKWVKIDDRTNDTSLNSQGAISSFSISEEFQSDFQMIRLRQTGKSGSSNDYLIVNAIEFFGVLKEPKH